jgi:hypothetical protein
VDVEGGISGTWRGRGEPWLGLSVSHGGLWWTIAPSVEAAAALFVTLGGTTPPATRRREPSRAPISVV